MCLFLQLLLSIPLKSFLFVCFCKKKKKKQGLATETTGEGRWGEEGSNLPTVSDFIEKKKENKNVSVRIKKKKSCHSGDCYDVLKLSMSPSTWIPFTTRQPCEEWKPHLCPRLNCFFFFLPLLFVNVKPQCGDALLHMRGSACLDRVSVLDLALAVHFLEVLEMHPGDYCLCKGMTVYHPGLLFEVLSCLEITTGGPFKFFFLPIHFSSCSHQHTTTFYCCIIQKSNLIVSYFYCCTVPGALDEMWWEKLLVSDSNSQSFLLPVEQHLIFIFCLFYVFFVKSCFLMAKHKLVSFSAFSPTSLIIVQYCVLQVVYV